MKMKKWLAGALATVMTLTTLVSPLSPVAHAADIVELNEGLVLYSSFDDSTAKDNSNNGHDGTVVGPIQFVEGVVGKAAKIKDQKTPGSSNMADRYIDYGKSAGIIPATGNFAVSLWIKSTAASTNGTILASKDYNSGANPGFVIGAYTSDLRVNIADSAKTRVELLGSNAALLKTPQADRAWHHLVTTVDRAGNITCYVDNQLAGTLSVTGIPKTIEAGFNLVLGADGIFKNAANNYEVDELCIYNRVINAAEIAALHGKTQPSKVFNPEVDLLLYNSFDADTVSGTTVTDLSGNGHNGTVVGAVAFVPGVSGNAVKLEGQNAAGDDDLVGDRYVKYGASNAIIPDTGNFTMSLWYQSTGASSNSTLLSNKNFKSGSNVGFAVGCFDKDLRMNLMATGAAKRLDIVGTSGTPLFAAKNGRWHHLTIAVDRTSSMTFYVDGVAAGSTAISTFRGNINAGLELVLGAGGNFTDALNNSLLDELRIYNKALTAANALAIYKMNSAPIELEALRAALAAMSPSALYSAEAIAAMLLIVTTAQETLSTLNPTEVDALLAKVNADYQTFLTGAPPVASFHLISDVHIPSSATTTPEAQNYAAALEQMKTINSTTTVALVNAGDFTNNSSAGEYEGFYGITAAHNPVNAEQMLIIQGNHDVRGPSGASEVNWNRDPTKPEKCVAWPAAKALYLSKNEPYFPEGSKETLYHAKELGGYTFIMLNTELGLKDAMYMSPAQLTWFESVMKAAYEKNPAKPIFIVGHQPLNDTHWLGNVMDGFDGILPDGTPQSYQTGADAKVKEIMAKYPSGIYLSGHIHNEFGRAEAVVRPYGVTVDLPSFGQGGINTTEKGTGFEVQIYDTMVLFRALNYVTGEWYPQYDISVPVGTENYATAATAAAKVLGNPLYYSEADIETAEAAAGRVYALTNRKYDQKALKWSSTEKAPVQFFGADTHAALREDYAEIDEALSAIVRLEIPRESPFKTARDKWRTYLLGGDGTDLDMTNSAVESYAANVNNTANDNWNEMVKSDVSGRSNLWLDLDMTPIKDYSNAAYTRSGNMGNTFTRLKSIAVAWATEGCDLYKSKLVKNELIKAMDHMIANYFKYGDKGYGNWYHWEITAPTAFMNTVMIMYDDLTAAQIAAYTKAAEWYVPACDVQGPHSNGPLMTGGNLLLKANAVAQCGILAEKASMLENVKSGVKTVLKYNDPSVLFEKDADGFFEDGSYIQHQGLPYIGGYGADLYNNLGIFLMTLSGSDWEIKYEDGSEKVAYDFVFNGIEPFIYETRTMDMVSSRAITRNGANDRGRTASMISAIMPLRGTFPTQAQNARFDSMMKYYLSKDPAYYYKNIGNIASLMMVCDLLADTSIQPRTDYAITKTFAMDKTVHTTKDFSLGLSMHSSRTYGHELINNEGKRTWNMSDGMFFLYNADEKQYGEGFWCSVDPTRLPGITAEHIVFNNGAGDRTRNLYDWTGGANVGGNGVAGTHFRTLGQASGNTRNGTDVKKSWFMFGDRIAFVGSDITSSTGNTVETVVDNRKILLDGSNVITVDGQTANLAATPTALTPNWMHLAGNVPGADVGYYFPEGTTVQALKETRTGNWKDQGDTNGTATGTYATFYVDHGKNPTDASYQYVLLPGKTAAQVAEYAAAPDIEILRNDSAVHAAKDRKANIVAANFWANQTASVEGITVDRAASVVLQRTGDTVTLAVADPTQRDTVIELSLVLTGTVESKDANITVIQTTPFIKLAVDTAKLAGGSSTITIKEKVAENRELVSTTSVFAPLSVELGTEFRALGLPQSAVFLANDMRQYTMELSWSRQGYNANSYGEYTLVGTPVLPSGVFNTVGLTVEITVRVGHFTVLATEDTYVRDDGKAAGSNADDSSLIIKNDATGYKRKTLLRFDISTLPTDYESVTFDFDGGIPDSGFKGAELYLVGNDWDQRAVTFATIPARRIATPVATVTQSGATGIAHVDLTATIRAAQAAGETILSFELMATGAEGGKNHLYIPSLEGKATVKPSLSWSKPVVSVAADKTNLTMLITLASGLEGGDFYNYDGSVLAAAIAAAQRVLEDGTANMADVNDAEDALLHVILSLRATPKKIV